MATSTTITASILRSDWPGLPLRQLPNCYHSWRNWNSLLSQIFSSTQHIRGEACKQNTLFGLANEISKLEIRTGDEKKVREACMANSNWHTCTRTSWAAAGFLTCWLPNLACASAAYWAMASSSCHKVNNYQVALSASRVHRHSGGMNLKKTSTYRVITAVHLLEFHWFDY